MTIPCLRTSPWGLALCLVAVAGTAILPPRSAHAQASTRIWGRVVTVDGDVHEGFLRWDRNEASWVDLLNGTKSLEWEEVREWVADTTVEVTSRDRIIEYGGYRITWDDDEAGFPSTAESGIHFGHLRRIEIAGDQEVEVELKSATGRSSVIMNENPIVAHPSPGVTVVLEGGSTDLGYDLRGLEVDVPGGDVEELEWADLSRVEFGPAPQGAQPRDRRLYGTVETRRGLRFTGAISWDNDEALGEDLLDGEDERGRDREIPFSRIAAVRPRGNGAEVTLVSGENLFLSGSNDVDDDNRGIQVSDPGLGQVDVDWDRLEAVRFHPPDPAQENAMSYEAFDGGRPLTGTVVTYTGEELTGRIRWDADEEFSWELLDAYERGITYDIELGQVVSIERGSGNDVLVTLADGRVLEVGGSNDVDEDNKGILVRTAELEAVEDEEGPKWIRVRWDDFERVRFDGGGEG